MLKNITIATAFLLFCEQNCYISNEDIKRIYSLREKKLEEVNLANYQKYYFDSVFGDDSNSSLTKEKPLKTLSKIPEILRNNGDIAILLRSNSIFEGNIIIERELDSYKTFVSNYDSGNLPKIIGEESVIRINSSNTYVSNLEVSGPSAYRGIHITPIKVGTMENIVVSSCYIHDINWNWSIELDSSLVDPDTLDLEKITPEYESDGITKGRYFYRYYGGIIAHNEIGPSEFKNIWIVNNIVKNVSRTGITVYNKWVDKPGVGYGYNKWVSYNTPNNYETGVGYFISYGIYCLDNYVENPGADGIVISSSKNVYVKGNTCYFANYLGREGYWNASIWVYNVDNCLFELNEAAYTYKRSGSEDAQGFDLDNCCVNTIFQNNYAHHNEGGGLLICNLATKVIKRDENGDPILDESNNEISEKITGKWFNNIVYNNYFYDNGIKEIPTRAMFLTIARESDLATFDSNIVVSSGNIQNQSVINTEDESTYCFNHTFKYNIFYSKKENNAQFTIKMMKNYQFIDNSFINITPIGNNLGKTPILFEKKLDFNDGSDIFKRANKAKENLKLFEEFISKGDYELC